MKNRKSGQIPGHIFQGRRHMGDLNINRINELYHKSKKEGLTDAEKQEQALLRKEYLAAIRNNVRSQLNQIDMKMEDGTIVNLGEKYGKHKPDKSANP